MSGPAAPAKTFRRPLPATWWLTKRTWFLFVLRELTSVFVAAFAVEVVLLVRSVAAGPEAYERFLDAMKPGWTVGLHVVGLAFVVYHTVTWFVAAPKAMRLKIGEEPVPPAAVILGHYAAWLVVSAGILWALLWRA